MLLKVLRKNSLGAASLIIMLVVLVWISQLLGKQPSYTFLSDSFPMPFYEPIAKFLVQFPFWYRFVPFILFFLSGLFLLNFNTKYIITKSRTYLPFLLFALCSAAFLPIQRLNPALLSLLFIMLGIDHIFATYQKREPLDNLFRAGLAIGAATLIYATGVIMILWAALALLVLRSFKIREWFVLFFAIAVPWLAYFVYRFIINVDVFEPFNTLVTNLKIDYESAIDDRLFWIWGGFLALPFAISLLVVYPRLAFQKIAIRRYYMLFLYLFLIGIGAYILVPGVSYEVFYITAVPSSFILSSYYSEAKEGIWAEILLWLPILGALVTHVVLLNR